MSNQHSVLEATLAWERETALLESIQATLEWDERTGMPEDAGDYRADQITLLSGMIHQRRTHSEQAARIEQLSQSVSSELPDSDLAVTVRGLRRDLIRRQKLPLELVQATTKAIVLGQQAWSIARPKHDFDSFLPHLQTIVSLKREEAQLLAIDGSPYNGLLDGYEEGAREADLAEMFTKLCASLVPIVAEAAESSRRKNQNTEEKVFEIEQQRLFNRTVAAAIGFNFKAGRLDETHHPFCTTLGPRDCRILTRYQSNDLMSGLFSTLHEAGHGMYEQGLPPDAFGLPLGSYASLGIHESQSRLWENAVGRSEPFWRWCLPIAKQYFPIALHTERPEDLYAQVNQVAPSLIRVEADEATYNLHIAIRFDLERSLIHGQLAPCDLPDAWSEAYQRYLGIKPVHHGEGVLQDVHWSAGLFGYFPTYTLGNLYAAQLIDTASKEIGKLDTLFEQGDFQPLLQWLRQHIHHHGKRYLPGELVRRITGQPISAEPFLTYLRLKLQNVGLLT